MSAPACLAASRSDGGNLGIVGVDVVPLRASGASSARSRGASCDPWGAMASLVTAVSGRNTPTGEWLAHLVWLGLGFPYI
jgi:hypothetical protein